MNVLLTGASRGIGAAVARALHARGDRVAAVARHREALAALPGAFPIAADLRTVEGPRDLVARAAAAMGPLDALVHCAGHAEHRALASLDEATIDGHFAVHLRAALLLARDLVSHAGDRPASIVFVGSTLALHGVPHTVAYAAAKGAVIAATHALAAELAPRVRVNCVVPGPVDTDMIAARAATLAARHPLGRLPTPDEVAATVLHALDAPSMTGAVLVLASPS